MAEGFARDFRRFFVRGLAAVLPTILTVMIVVYVFTFAHAYIGKYVNIGVLTGLEWFFGRLGIEAPPALAQIWTRYFWWVGFVLAIVGVYIFGRFAASFLGRGIWRMVEGMLRRTPIIGQIYPMVKQVTDLLLSEKRIEFSRVVAVEYPRKGLWSIGLVTSMGMRSLHGQAECDLLTVFVPSSPMPLTGYTITVRRDEVVDVPISIDDAMRFVVSGGVIMPLSQQMSQAEIECARQGVFPPLEHKETAE